MLERRVLSQFYLLIIFYLAGARAHMSMCVCIVYVCVCVCIRVYVYHMYARAFRCKRRVLDSLELKLKAVVSTMVRWKSNPSPLQEQKDSERLSRLPSPSV